MPELPEVENIVRSLRPRIIGKRIRGVEVFDPVIVSEKGAARKGSSGKARTFSRTLTGERFTKIERLGKNLVFTLASGKVLLAHLKMTGQFLYIDAKQTSRLSLPDAYTRIHFILHKGRLFYRDVRRFGYVLLYPSRKALERSGHFAKLGVEPLTPLFTLPAFRDQLHKKSRSRLKPALMSQEVVVGLGNIYCDEVCFAADIRPERRINTLTVSEMGHLRRGIVSILQRAIKFGGSSISNYVRADGTGGVFAAQHKVYARAGKPCVSCAQPLTKTILAGRTTVFCKRCQK